MLIKKLILILTLTTCSLNLFAEVNILDIVKKADLKRGLGNVSHSFKVSISSKTDPKVEIFKVSFKDINSTLSEQLEPERARGRKMLMKDYDMWLFTPNIKKPIRISLEQKLTGEVSYGDIAKTNYADDYTATLIDTEKQNGKELYKIDLKAKNKKVTYSKIEYFVDKSDNSPVSATFFALSGKPLKKAEFLNFKEVKGIKRSTKMVIHDFLILDKESTLIFSDHTLETFDESTFNKDRLEF